MKPILSILLCLVAFLAVGQEYTLKKTLDDSGSQAGYSYFGFSNKTFASDTIAYGDTAVFNVYVDFNKHVPVAPMLYVLLQEAGASDSLKATREIYYSQFAALGSDNLGSLEGYYYKAFKTTASVINFNSEAYYPVTVADSIVSTGLAYPSFSMARSVLYKITIIPLKTNVKVKVRDIRFKLLANLGQFK